MRGAGGALEPRCGRATLGRQGRSAKGPAADADVAGRRCARRDVRSVQQAVSIIAWVLAVVSGAVARSGAPAWLARICSVYGKHIRCDSSVRTGTAPHAAHAPDCTARLQVRHELPRASGRIHLGAARCRALRRSAARRPPPPPPLPRPGRHAGPQQLQRRRIALQRAAAAERRSARHHSQAL